VRPLLRPAARAGERSTLIQLSQPTRLWSRNSTPKAGPPHAAQRDHQKKRKNANALQQRLVNAQRQHPANALQQRLGERAQRGEPAASENKMPF
jgi:hypothetical protein